ncbi:hypothetical protein DFS34DRAFT_652363 [Phlyctochytrium arcticum]|nr:hypothetical protein DFS34DRAFT_652363 [Phlyctochytrium arcticum]
MEIDQIFLLGLYALSTILAIELILLFSRVKKNITLRFFAFAYILFAITIFAGMAITQGNIKTLDPELCRAQALAILYLLSVMYVLNFFLTFNVWSAVCTSKFRDQERRRFPWYLGASIIFAVVPTLVVAMLNSQEPTNRGFGPHNVYCTYIFPINGYAYGPLPFNAMFCVFTVIMISHAGLKLLVYRRRNDSTHNNSITSGSSGQIKSSSTATTSAASRISLSMVYRFGIWGIIFLTVMICANFQQVRAVINQAYQPTDLKLGAREYSGALVGVCFWLVFGTGRAAWKASTPYVVFSYFSRGGRSRSSSTSAFSAAPVRPQQTQSMSHMMHSPTTPSSQDSYSRRTEYDLDGIYSKPTSPSGGYPSPNSYSHSQPHLSQPQNPYSTSIGYPTRHQPPSPPAQYDSYSYSNPYAGGHGGYQQSQQQQKPYGY